MSPNSSAVRLNGNQNFFLSRFLCTFLFLFGVKEWRAYSYFTEEAKLVTGLLFQGQIQAVSQGTSPNKNRVTYYDFCFKEWQAMSVLTRGVSFLKMWHFLTSINCNSSWTNLLPCTCQFKILVIQIAFYVKLCAVLVFLFSVVFCLFCCFSQNFEFDHLSQV